jgi:hypothetical protein
MAFLAATRFDDSEQLGTMNPNESQGVVVNCPSPTSGYARIEARACRTPWVEMTPQRFDSYTLPPSLGPAAAAKTGGQTFVGTGIV